MKLNPKDTIAAALFAAGEPISIDRLSLLFGVRQRPDKKQMKKYLTEIQAQHEEGPLELKEVASGYRFQVRQEYAESLQRLWEKKMPRYSRALLETLALIIYRQPITRGEIEDVRGVAVSTQIIKTLQERNWVKVAGHRDVPGKPALFVTTKEFLDYFNLQSIKDLPPLEEIVDIDQVEVELNKQLALNVNIGDDNVESVAVESVAVESAENADAQEDAEVAVVAVDGGDEAPEGELNND